MNFFETDATPALEAQKAAYWISFAPSIFQATRVLSRSGILTTVQASRQAGITLEEIAEKVKLPVYGTRVLLEAGLGIGLVLRREGRFYLTKTGYFVITEKPININMNFIHDVCYQGLFYLEDSIVKGKPEGLKVFGDWSTIYEGLSELPEQAKDSWFTFDHYFSDDAFPKAVPIVLKDTPRKIMDIGGNTGKFALELLKRSPDARVTILDLPGQIKMARQNIAPYDVDGRVDYHPINMLDENQALPNGYDAIWMSQFLDCFSEEQIVSILKKCYNAMDEHASVFILDGFWDKQRYEASALCLQQLSLYFTTMANGNSQMYSAEVFKKCIDDAGLEIVDQVDHLSISNTLLKCKKK